MSRRRHHRTETDAFETCRWFETSMLFSASDIYLRELRRLLVQFVNCIDLTLETREGKRKKREEAAA